MPNEKASVKSVSPYPLEVSVYIYIIFRSLSIKLQSSERQGLIPVTVYAFFWDSYLLQVSEKPRFLLKILLKWKGTQVRFLTRELLALLKQLKYQSSCEGKRQLVLLKWKTF